MAQDTRELGALIRARRQALNMTGQELATKWGMSLTYVHSLERGEVNPASTANMVRLAEILELDADTVLAMVGRMRPAHWRHFWSDPRVLEVLSATAGKENATRVATYVGKRMGDEAE
jgi:transcriptional regulator with XRE-family HTH domain